MTTCEQVVKNSEPYVGMDTYSVHIGTMDTSVTLLSRNRNSFTLPIILWVYGKKVQVKALVDSGATTTFINKSAVESNNLVTHNLVHSFDIYNADGALNKSGKINQAICFYVEIGTHKSTHQLLVADLGNKKMIIGYTYLQKHNSEID